MERCRRSAGSSLSPNPPDVGSACSSAEGRPAGTGKSLRIAKEERREESALKGSGGGGGDERVCEGELYLWRFVVHGPTSFGKLFHVFEDLVFHFRRQAGELL